MIINDNINLKESNDFELEVTDTSRVIEVYATLNNQVAGSATASIESNIILNDKNVSNYWYFNRLIVQPQFRSMGLADKLLDKFLSIIKQHNYILVCDVNAYGDLDTNQLTNLYLKHGMKEATVSYGNMDYQTLTYNFI